VKKLIALLFLSLVVSPAAFTQTVSIIKFGQLKEMMEKQSDTTYVFNFWATWCGPCVKEFPDFQKVSEKYTDKKIRVIFISLDFKKNYENTLVPFIKKKNVKNTVYLLDEPDYNSWIDKVYQAWGGELPATLIINNKSSIKKIYPHEFTFEELENTLKPFIQ